MVEVSRSQTLRDNERLKHFAGVVTAWANALVIGGSTQMALKHEPTLVGTVMIGTGLFMVWLCSLGLTMLMAEGEL